MTDFAQELPREVIHFFERMLGCVQRTNIYYTIKYSSLKNKLCQIPP